MGGQYCGTSMLEQSAAEPRSGTKASLPPEELSLAHSTLPESHSGSDNTLAAQPAPPESSKLFWMRPSGPTDLPISSQGGTPAVRAANPPVNFKAELRDEAPFGATGAAGLQLFGRSLGGRGGKELPLTRRGRKSQASRVEPSDGGQSSPVAANVQTPHQNLFFSNLLVSSRTGIGCPMP